MAAVTVCSTFGRAPSAHPVQLLIPKSYQIRQATLFPQVSERLKQGQGCYSSNTPSSGQKYGGRQCLQPLQHAQGVYPLRHCTSLLTRAVGLSLEERDVTVRTRDPFIPQHSLPDTPCTIDSRRLQTGKSHTPMKPTPAIAPAFHIAHPLTSGRLFWPRYSNLKVLSHLRATHPIHLLPCFLFYSKALIGV